MKKIFVFAVAIAFFTSCELKDEDQTVDYNGFQSQEVSDVFVSCASSGCHGGIESARGLNLESYTDLMNGSSSRPLSNGSYSGEVIIPFNSGKSLLYQIVTGNTSELNPNHSNILSDAEKNVLKNWINNGAKNYKNEIAFSNSSYNVYVCNQSGDAVSVIDGDQKVVSRIIDLNFNNSIEAPHMIKEYGEYIYVTLISAGKLIKIRKSDLQIVGELNGLFYPGMIQLYPERNKIYVSRSSTAPGVYSSIYVVNLDDLSLRGEIDLLLTGVPHGISLAKQRNRLYCADLIKNYIYVIDAVADEVISPIALTSNYEPMQTTISPDENFLYFSSRGTGELLVMDLNTTNIISTVAVSPMPMHIAVSSNGNKIYVGSMMNSTVSVVSKDGLVWTKTATISHPAFSQLHGCDLTADDKYLYVSSRNQNGSFIPSTKVNGEGNIGNVGIINTQTNTVEKVIEIEEFGSGLVVEK